MARALSILSLVSLVASVTACGHAGVAGSTARLRATGGGSATLFDPHAARLGAAHAALERVVGHDVEIEIDRALASGREGSFGGDVAREIEDLARSIEGAARHGERVRDVVFAGLLSDLARIEVRYEVVTPTRVYDAARRSLVARIAVGSRWSLADALFAERDRRLEARYAGRTPSQVPGEEIDLDVWWLAREARRGDSARSSWAIAQLVAIAGAGAFAPETRRAARAGALEGAASVRWPSPADRGPRQLDAATATAFAAWARAGLSRFDQAELELLARSVSAEPPLPSLDPGAMIFAAADVWAATGRPVLAFDASDVELERMPPLVARVLAPGTLSPNTRLFEAAARRPEGLASVARELDARGDGVLRAIVFLHLVEASCESGNAAACPRVEETFCKPGVASLPAGVPPDVTRRVASRCERARTRR